tara:strand:- start:1624 stop:1884 length:261 start_codon:yes stop_codon:yes gene_type:complete
MSYQSPPLPEWGSGRTESEKQRNQVKSRFYYLFWGIATTSVVLGQVYVGAGYRAYSKALMQIFESVAVEFERDNPTGQYEFINDSN